MKKLAHPDAKEVIESHRSRLLILFVAAVEVLGVDTKFTGERRNMPS